MVVNKTPSGGRCSMCGHSPLESKLIDDTFEYGTGDETIIVTARQVPVQACAKCGETYSGPEAARVEHEAICQALGLMTPSEIKALRDQFGWSQKDLAALTDLGIATISRSERGRHVQDRSTNMILQALRDCPGFRQYREGFLAGKTTESGFDEPEPSADAPAFTAG